MQAEDLRRNSRMKQWRPMTLAEMNVYLSVIISMGFVHIRDVQDLLPWSLDRVQDTPFYWKTCPGTDFSRS